MLGLRKRSNKQGREEKKKKHSRRAIVRHPSEMNKTRRLGGLAKRRKLRPGCGELAKRSVSAGMGKTEGCLREKSARDWEGNFSKLTPGLRK